jgi:DNA-binding NarL/FixJ family response regulator
VSDAVRTIWVVEDNTMLRRALTALIDEQADMTCPLALGSCEDLMAALDGGSPPDILLVDIGLPGRSGIDGVARVTSEWPETKAIILTIHGEDDKVIDAIRAGASGYLLKPAPPEEIVEALREVARGAAPINPYIASKVLELFSRMAPARPTAPRYGITDREREILALLVAGHTMNAIAERLAISYHTVNNHVRSIYRKLHVRSRASVVAKALREDLVPGGSGERSPDSG